MIRKKLTLNNQKKKPIHMEPRPPVLCGRIHFRSS